MFEAIQQIDYEVSTARPPKPIATLIEHGDALWQEFLGKGLNQRFPRYVASDPNEVFAAIAYVFENELAAGDRFVEWGSGFGVATNMAAQIGFESVGVEIEPNLCRIAEKLAKTHSTNAHFIERSYIPKGIVSYPIQGGTQIEVATSSDRPFHYEELEYGLDEVDVFFVYPWPGEQEMMLSLFEAVAAPDAILITYFGEGEVCLYRRL